MVGGSKTVAQIFLKPKRRTSPPGVNDIYQHDPKILAADAREGKGDK